MQMMNASLEDVKTQCDSQVFRFKAREKIEVPQHLSKFLLDQLSKKGIFIVPDKPEDFEKAHYAALRNYLNGTLKIRIQNYLHEQDEFKKKGVTLQPSKDFERALRHQKELTEILNEKAPDTVELSYLDMKDMKIEAEVQKAFEVAVDVEKKTRIKKPESYKEMAA